MEPGLTYTSEQLVTEDITAAVIGSGDMLVLATPMMLALMENAAMKAVSDELPDGNSTVGGHIDCSHLRPTAVGRTITATATLLQVEGRKLTFHIEAHDDDGNLLGEGTHLRFIVDRQKFMKF